MNTYTPQDFVVWPAQGTDLPNQPMTGNLTDCQTACDANFACLGFSRLKTSEDGARDSCFLKQNLNNKSPQQVYQTYVKDASSTPQVMITAAPLPVTSVSSPPASKSSTGMYIGIGFAVLCCCILAIVAIYFATKKKT